MDTFEFSMLMGREVGMCGNAIRCVAWLLMMECGRERIALETLVSIFECRLSRPSSVAVDLCRPSRNWLDIPLREKRDTLQINLGEGPLSNGVGMNMGGPHIVFFVSGLDQIDVPSLASPVQADSLFPEQVNVGVAEIRGSDRMALKVWERPGILTLSCASGACAAVAAARARGLILTGHVTVEMPAVL